MASPDPEGVSWLRFVVAFVTVMGLMGLMAYILKYLANRGLIIPAAGAARRLKVIETLPLDARRRLVIVQRDGAEHLLLLGLQQDLVVETNISDRVSRSVEP